MCFRIDCLLLFGLLLHFALQNYTKKMTYTRVYATFSHFFVYFLLQLFLNERTNFGCDTPVRYLGCLLEAPR